MKKIIVFVLALLRSSALADTVDAVVIVPEAVSVGTRPTIDAINGLVIDRGDGY